MTSRNFASICRMMTTETSADVSPEAKLRLYDKGIVRQAKPAALDKAEDFASFPMIARARMYQAQSFAHCLRCNVANTRPSTM
jgi:hypothetical protein